MLYVFLCSRMRMERFFPTGIAKKASAFSGGTMRAVFFRRFGGPEVLEEGDLPTPEPARGEDRLRGPAAALNHPNGRAQTDPTGGRGGSGAVSPLGGLIGFRLLVTKCQSLRGLTVFILVAGGGLPSIAVPI